MPRYDFAHPTFKRGFVEFPEKKPSAFETFCRLARNNGAMVLRNQMVITKGKYRAKVFDRGHYIEIHSNGNRIIMHHEMEMITYFNSI